MTGWKHRLAGYTIRCHLRGAVLVALLIFGCRENKIDPTRSQPAEVPSPGKSEVAGQPIQIFNLDARVYLASSQELVILFDSGSMVSSYELLPPGWPVKVGEVTVENSPVETVDLIKWDTSLGAKFRRPVTVPVTLRILFRDKLGATETTRVQIAKETAPPRRIAEPR